MHLGKDVRHPRSLGHAWDPNVTEAGSKRPMGNDGWSGLGKVLIQSLQTGFGGWKGQKVCEEAYHGPNRVEKWWCW